MALSSASPALFLFSSSGTDTLPIVEAITIVFWLLDGPCSLDRSTLIVRMSPSTDISTFFIGLLLGYFYDILEAKESDSASASFGELQGHRAAFVGGNSVALILALQRVLSRQMGKGQNSTKTRMMTSMALMKRDSGQPGTRIMAAPGQFGLSAVATWIAQGVLSIIRYLLRGPSGSSALGEECGYGD